MVDLSRWTTLLRRGRTHLPYSPPGHAPLVVLAALVAVGALAGGEARPAPPRAPERGYRTPSGVERPDPSVVNRGPLVPEAVRPVSATTLAATVALLPCERLASARVHERPAEVVVTLTSGVVAGRSCEGRARTSRVLLHLRRPLGSRTVLLG